MLHWALAKFQRSRSQPLPVAAAERCQPQQMGFACMPGVGIVDLSQVKKTRHEPSVVSTSPPNSSAKVPSTIAPSIAFVKPCSEFGVAELSLGPGKSPVCVVLSEDVIIAQPLASRKTRTARRDRDRRV